MNAKEISDYMSRQAKLVLYMFKIGFTKDEVITAVNALRVKKDLQLIVDVLNKQEAEKA